MSADTPAEAIGLAAGAVALMVDQCGWTSPRRIAVRAVEAAEPAIRAAERARCIRIALESARKLRDAAGGTPRGQCRLVAANALEVLVTTLREQSHD